MWWLAALGVLAIFAMVLVISWNDDDEHLISLDKVKAIMKKAGQPLPEGRAS